MGLAVHPYGQHGVVWFVVGEGERARATERGGERHQVTNPYVQHKQSLRERNCKGLGCSGFRVEVLRSGFGSEVVPVRFLSLENELRRGLWRVESWNRGVARDLKTAWRQ